MQMRPAVHLRDAGIFEAALNGLAAGVLLTADDGKVIYMNAAAKRQIDAGKAIRLVNNRLEPTDPKAARAFAAVLRSASAAQPCRSVALALPDREGAGLVATLLPLDDGQASVASPRTTTAAIFIQDPAAIPPFPGEAFGRLCGLTNAELRVVLALAPGIGLQKIANEQGVALNTIRTHLKLVFQKTYTCRQADLVALILRIAGPADFADSVRI